MPGWPRPHERTPLTRRVARMPSSSLRLRSRNDPPDGRRRHHQCERGDDDPGQVQSREWKRSEGRAGSAGEDSFVVHDYQLLSVFRMVSQIAFAWTPWRKTSKVISTRRVAASAICAGPRALTVTMRSVTKIPVTASQ